MLSWTQNYSSINKRPVECEWTNGSTTSPRLPNWFMTRSTHLRGTSNDCAVVSRHINVHSHILYHLLSVRRRWRRQHNLALSMKAREVTKTLRRRWRSTRANLLITWDRYWNRSGDQSRKRKRSCNQNPRSRGSCFLYRTITYGAWICFPSSSTGFEW